MRNILSALLLTLVLAACNSKPAPEYAVAADWTLTTAGGQALTLSNAAAERPVILFFWATWCPYCKALMPHLQSMRLEYGDAIEILAVSIFEDGDPVKFIETAGYDFTLLPEGDAVAEMYEVTGTPGVFVVDRARAIRFDMRDLPSIDPPDTGKKPSHGRKAAFRAPYWAAEVRKAIDSVLRDPE